MLIALFFLSAIITILTTLIRQRLSVPELSKQKHKNSLVLFFGIISISSLFMIFILDKYSMTLSRNLGFVDNIFNIVFMLSSFIFCFFSFDLLNKLSLKENPADLGYLFYKKFLLIFMFTQQACYIFNYLLISLYNPMIFTEKILLSTMVILINVNSIAFYYMFAVFVFTMKYDLSYVNMQLEVLPDLEFFLSEQEDLIKSQMDKMI